MKRIFVFACMVVQMFVFNSTVFAQERIKVDSNKIEYNNIPDSLLERIEEIPSEQYIGFKEGSIKLQDFYELLWCYSDPDCYAYLITKDNVMIPEVNPNFKEKLLEFFTAYSEKEKLPKEKTDFVVRLIKNLK